MVIVYVGDAAAGESESDSSSLDDCQETQEVHPIDADILIEDIEHHSEAQTHYNGQTGIICMQVQLLSFMGKVDLGVVCNCNCMYECQFATQDWHSLQLRYPSCIYKLYQDKVERVLHC